MAIRGLPSGTKFRAKVSQHLPAANTAAVVTLAAVSDERHAIAQIDFGYAVAVPTAGAAVLLTVSGLNDDGAITYTISPRVEVGLQSAIFSEPLIGKVGGAVVVTLAAGGGTSVAELNVIHAQ